MVVRRRRGLLEQPGVVLVVVVVVFGNGKTLTAWSHRANRRYPHWAPIPRVPGSQFTDCRFSIQTPPDQSRSIVAEIWCHVLIPSHRFLAIDLFGDDMQQNMWLLLAPIV
jgi:hypothetical protein